MAAGEYICCKQCGEGFNDNDKSVLCGGKCGSLFHINCLPLNKSEKNALSESRNLWWLCDVCTTINPGSIVKAFTDLISTISTLNEEISALKDIVKCTHTTLQNDQVGKNHNCSCQVSLKRKVQENGGYSSGKLNMKKPPSPTKPCSKMELDCTNPVDTKTESISTSVNITDSTIVTLSSSETIDDANTGNHTTSIKEENISLCNNESTSISVENPKETPKGNESQVLSTKNQEKHKVDDSVKHPKRSRRPRAYKVNEYYYY